MLWCVLTCLLLQHMLTCSMWASSDAYPHRVSVEPLQRVACQWVPWHPSMWVSWHTTNPHPVSVQRGGFPVNCASTWECRFLLAGPGSWHVRKISQHPIRYGNCTFTIRSEYRRLGRMSLIFFFGCSISVIHIFAVPYIYFSLFFRIFFTY